MPDPPDRPLRVLVLATTFPARSGDGTPEFVLTLSSGLAATGAEVTAVVPRVPGGVAEEVMDGVRVRRFAYFPERWEGLADGAIMPNLRAEPWRWAEAPPLVWRLYQAAAKEIRRQRPDVVHAHWIVPAGLVASMLHRRHRLPFVITAHGADAYTLRGKATSRLKRAALQAAEATVPVSESIATELAPLAPVQAPIPMGVDGPRIRAEVGERRPEAGRILFVGRLVEKKGIDVLVRALPTVPDAQLVIVGDGPQRAELQALVAATGTTDRVTFLGQCPRDQVMTELARAAVVAIPSQVGAGGDQDGTPVVLGEAIAAGVPIVVSALGGLAEHVVEGVSGRVVTPGSVDELAAALREVLADPEGAERLAAGALDGFNGSLDLASVADRYRKVLDEAAGR